MGLCYFLQFSYTQVNIQKILLCIRAYEMHFHFWSVFFISGVKTCQAIQIK